MLATKAITITAIPSTLFDAYSPVEIRLTSEVIKIVETDCFIKHTK
jgi:hypothetical protein